MVYKLIVSAVPYTMFFCYISGIDLDSTSSKSLANSLENYKPRAVNELEAIGKWQTMMSILSKAMVNAEYFCTGMYVLFFFITNSLFYKPNF